MTRNISFLCLVAFRRVSLVAADPVEVNIITGKLRGNNDDAKGTISSKLSLSEQEQPTRKLWRIGGGGSTASTATSNRNRNRNSYSSSHDTQKYGRRHGSSSSDSDSHDRSFAGFTSGNNKFQDNNNDDDYRDDDYFNYIRSSSKGCPRNGRRKGSKGSSASGTGKGSGTSKGRSKGSSPQRSRSKGSGKGKGNGSSRSSCNEEGLEEILCSANIEEFGSAVLVSFVGEPEFLTGPEQFALEESFENVYNELTFANCDGYFRQVESADLFVSDGRRRQRQRYLQTSSANATSSYSVVGTCRDCPISSAGSFSLFDDAFRRRELSITTDKNANKDWMEAPLRIRRKQQQLDVCTCPDQGLERRLQLQQSDLEPDAPTEEEFLDALNQDIERLVDEGVIRNIESIDTLEEIPVDEEVEVMCSSNIEDFTSYVDVTFRGDVSAFSGMEISILGILFEQVYNDLTFENCDGFFRMTDATTLVPVSTTGGSYFQVGATCRDCPVDPDGGASLFSNTRRQLDATSLNALRNNVGGATYVNQDKRYMHDRNLQGMEDVCFCLRTSGNLDTLLPLAPSLNNMQQEMNVRIAELRRAGMITNIVSIASMSESNVPRTPGTTDNNNPVTAAPSIAEVPPVTTVPTIGTMEMESPPPKTMPPSMEMETPSPKTMPPSMDKTMPPKTMPPSMDKTMPPSPEMESPPPKTMPPSPEMKEPKEEEMKDSNNEEPKRSGNDLDLDETTKPSTITGAGSAPDFTPRNRWQRSTITSAPSAVPIPTVASTPTPTTAPTVGPIASITTFERLPPTLQDIETDFPTFLPTSLDDTDEDTRHLAKIHRGKRKKKKRMRRYR